MGGTSEFVAEEEERTDIWAENLLGKVRMALWGRLKPSGGKGQKRWNQKWEKNKTCRRNNVKKKKKKVGVGGGWRQGQVGLGGDRRAWGKRRDAPVRETRRGEGAGMDYSP